MPRGFRSLALACFVAGGLWLCLFAGALADRGGNGNNANHGNSRPTSGPVSHGSGNVTNGTGPAKAHDNESSGSADDASADSAPLVAVTSTGATSTPTVVEAAKKTHPENHGEEVSDAAHAVPPGPGHGEEVSEIARTGAETDFDESPTATPTTLVCAPTCTPTSTPTATATATGVATDTATATTTATGVATDTATATTTATITATPTTTSSVSPTASPDEAHESDVAPNSERAGVVAQVVNVLIQDLAHLLGS